MNKNVFKLTGLFAIAALAFANVASADEAPLAVPASADAVNADEVIDMSELGDLVGGDGVSIEMLTKQTLSAVNAGNSIRAGTVDSGDINLAPSTFDGFDGIGNFVMNTGHNNNLQSSLNVSIVLAP